MRSEDKKILEAVRKKSNIDDIIRSLGRGVDKKEVEERLIFLVKRGYITGYPGELKLTREGYNALFSSVRLTGLGDRVKVRVMVPLKVKPTPQEPRRVPKTRNVPSLPAFELPDVLGRVKKSFEIRGTYTEKAWKPMLLIAEGILVPIFFLILVNKENFTNIEYFTALTVLGVSTVFAGLLLRYEEEDRCFTLSYLSGFMLITTAVVLTIRIKGYSTTALIPFLLGALIIASQGMRFRKLTLSESLWITAASYAGFWIILGKFSGLGVLGLVLAINTALLIGFLSRALLKEGDEV